MSTTYSSGLLSDAIAKWQVNVEAEGHGKYATTNTDEETVGNVYEREFDVIFAVIFCFQVLCSTCGVKLGLRCNKPRCATFL